MNTNTKFEFSEVAGESVWAFGEVEFNEARWELRVRGGAVELEPKPLEILGLLLRHAGEVVTRDELLEAVWPGVVVVEKVLTNAIGKLRRAIGDADQTVIETLHRAGYRFNAKVTRQPVRPADAAQLTLKAGDAVPRRPQWRLLQPFVQAASAEVWLAQHDKTGERRVFKFAADGLRLSSLKREATLSRVLAEALGERPDLVRVLEWNFDDAPYFLECEYGGQDWTAWAQSQGGLSQVPLPQRLQIFLQAADAVAAAHSVGVLHKDLKPANLLIEARPNGGWQVRITDFGSGRLLEPGRLTDLGVTRLGFTQTRGVFDDSMAGTPLYLAPEVLAGQMPTQGADVYALGVLLYQMTVGDLRKPISAGWGDTVQDELLREDIAAAASGDPARRLHTVHELAERLRTLPQRRDHRARDEAMARRTAGLQRELELTRAVRPWAIGAVLSLAAGVAVGALYLHKALRAEANAETQRQRAEAVNEFLDDDLLSAADPLLTGRSGVTVLEAVRSSAAEVDRRFAGNPDSAAAVHEALARAFDNAGDGKSAAAESERAARLYVGLYGPASPEAVRARLRQALSLSASGEAQAGQQALDAVQQSLAGRPPQPELQALLLGARASLASQSGDFAAARKDAEAALAQADLSITQDKDLRRQDADLLKRLSKDYAFALEQTGDAAKAEPVMRAVLEQDRKRLGPEHAQVLVDTVRLAQALDAETPPKPEGEQLLRTTEPKLLQTLGPDNPYEELIFSELGSLAMQNKDWAGAIQAFDASYRQSRRLHGEAHQHTVVEAFNLGLAYRHLGQLPQALTTLRSAQINAVKLFGAEAPLPQLINYLLADTLLASGHAAEAQPLVARLKPEQLASAEPDNDWSARLGLLHAGLAYAQSGAAADAQHLNQAMQQMSASSDDERADLVAQAQLLLGGAGRQAISAARAP